LRILLAWKQSYFLISNSFWVASRWWIHFFKKDFSWRDVVNSSKICWGKNIIFVILLFFKWMFFVNSRLFDRCCILLASLRTHSAVWRSLDIDSIFSHMCCLQGESCGYWRLLKRVSSVGCWEGFHLWNQRKMKHMLVSAFSSRWSEKNSHIIFCKNCFFWIHTEKVNTNFKKSSQVRKLILVAPKGFFFHVHHQKFL
jgi:hypothetical protein